MRVFFAKIGKIAFCSALCLIPVSVATMVKADLLAPSLSRSGDNAPDIFYGKSLAGLYLIGNVAHSHYDFAMASQARWQIYMMDPVNKKMGLKALHAALAAGDMDKASQIMALLRENSKITSGEMPLPSVHFLIAQAVKDKDFAAIDTILTSYNLNKRDYMTAVLLKGWTQKAQNIPMVDIEKTLSVLRAYKELQYHYYYHIGFMYVLDGHKDKGLEALHKAMKLSGKKQSTLHDIVALMEKDDRTEQENQALSFQGISSAQEGIASIFLDRVLVFARAQNYDLALIYLNLTEYVQPAMYVAELLRADIHEKTGYLQQASQIYRSLLEKNIAENSLPSIVLPLANIVYRQKQTEQALSLLQEYKERFPESPVYRVTIASLYQQEKQYEQAVSELHTAMDLFEEQDILKRADGYNRWELLYMLGTIQDQNGNWPQAEKYLKAALEIEPENPNLLNYLGYSWVDRGIHLDQALDMLKMAVQVRPDNGYIVDSLGWAYFRLGKYRQAIEYLEEAVLLAPGDPTINDHLGDAYWRVCRKKEAIFQWKHVLTFLQDDAERQRIEDKIQDGIPADKSLACYSQKELAAWYGG